MQSAFFSPLLFSLSFPLNLSFLLETLPMEGEESKVINGTAKDFSLKEANNSSGEELRTPKASEEGAEDTIKNFHHEIESLRRERSNLYLQIDNLKAEIEKAAASAESLAIHATHLERQLIRAQEDLSAATATAEDASEMEKVLDEVRSKNSELEARIEAMASKKRDMVVVPKVEEEEMGKTMLRLREENAELGGTVCNYEGTFSKEDVLENTLKKMVDRNTDLERKLGELATAVGPSFSWAITTAVAACTAAVSIAVTTIYLRGQSY